MPHGRGVALLTEGVGRNFLQHVPVYGNGIVSPSSRRAWVEIWKPTRKEAAKTSPSSRRAWVEIALMGWGREDVVRRPPHGGRG